jgi:hypothetical protein
MRWSGSGAETAASSKRLNDGGRDKAECGKPAYRPDQHIRHAAVFPRCQRRRLMRGMEQKAPVSKKEPRTARGLSDYRVD